jgi:hypothetical protein
MAKGYKSGTQVDLFDQKMGGRKSRSIVSFCGFFFSQEVDF